MSRLVNYFHVQKERLTSCSLSEYVHKLHPQNFWNAPVREVFTVDPILFLQDVSFNETKSDWTHAWEINRMHLENALDAFRF